MKKNRLHLLFLFLLLHLVAFAGPRSFQQAKQIAKRQAALHGIVMDEAATSLAKSTGNSAVSSELSAYYVFPNGEGKGFTIVSGDDRLPEIVGYSVEGTYDEASLPANYVSFMKAYQEMVELMEKGDAHAVASAAEANALRSSSYQQPTISPLLGEIAWNQSEPYNNMCPLYNKKDHAATGCVATAMAQVMMYYQYPEELKEDIPAYVTRSHRLSIPSISKGEKYDWSNMLPIYLSNSYNDTQASAVAKLLYHCGAAVQMDYSSSSAASVTSARLAKYFGYDADMMVDLSRSTFTLAEWTQIMDKELEARRPILYSGQSSDGGHEFVCDGSDGNGLYHINWGWGGYQDGYFDVTILNPEKGGVGSGNAPDGYNRDCGMLVGIAPDNGKADDPVVDLTPIVVAYNERVSSLGIIKAERNNETEKFSVKVANCVYNQSTQVFSGSIAMGVKDDNGTYTPISEKKSVKLLGMENGSAYVVYPDFNFDYAFPIGQTTLYVIYSADGGTWKPCAYSGMEPYVVEATATTLTVSKNLLAVSIKEQEELLGGMENNFELSISNPSDVEYLGKLNVYGNSVSTQPSRVSESLYVTVPAHATINRILSLTPAAGDFYVWVTDKNGETLVNAQKFTVAQSDAPILSVTEAYSNATAGDYETENAFYNSYQVKAPRVNDDKVVFSYKIKNDGGTATVRYVICGVNCETSTYSPTIESVRLPGNGAETTISREFTPTEVGSRSICSDLYFADNVTCSTSLPSYKLYAVGSNGYFSMGAVEMMVYVAGKATGVSSVPSASSYVRGAKGEIIVLSDKTKLLPVYNLNGQKVTDVKVVAGERQYIPVASGLYIVDGKKIVVR